VSRRGGRGPAAPRLTADARLRRILAVVPWVVAEDGPTLAEVCARFGYNSEAELQSDLNLLFVCGVPPYTPDALIEVDVADGRVWIRYADWFARPLRLTAAEALTLVAASAALLGSGGTGDLDGPLARALAKLAAALGVTDEVVDVALGAASEDHRAVLEAAAGTHHQVEIDYYAYGRDEQTTRVVDPQLVYSTAGQWYLAGWCHLAGAERLFRLDRIGRAVQLESTFVARPGVGPRPPFEPSAADPLVVLDLEPAGSWAATQYPTESVLDLGAGRQRVTLRVSGEAWLARLLLRLGDDATLVDGDGSSVGRAAGRILARYGPGGGGRGRGVDGRPDPVASTTS
jgi:proteasome accessory factor C